MAELKCKDGTVIKISDETEAELRKVFGSRPSYKDITLETYVNEGRRWPVTIKIKNSQANIILTRDVEDTEAFITALQKAVEYCKLFGLGL